MPLEDGRPCPGRVVIRWRDVLLLCYFFPPVVDPPTLAEVQELQPEDAVLAIVVSGLGIASGEWPLLGGSDDFAAAAWPVPEFEQVIRGAGTYEFLHVERLDVQLSPYDRRKLPVEQAGQRQEAGTFGSVAAQRYFAHRWDTGALQRLGSQCWWAAAAAESAALGAPAPVVTPPVLEESEPAELVRLVLPGKPRGSLVDAVESLLLLELDPDVEDVDGWVAGAAGAEILIYTPDAEALARQLPKVLADEDLPAGSHLIVRRGGPGSAERPVPLR